MSDETPSGADEQPTRICRRCSTASSATGDFCPSCGTSYVRRSRRPSRRIVISTLVVLLLAGGATGGVLAKKSADAAERDRASAAAQAEAQESADESERSARRDIVTALEEQVLKDAEEKVTEDLLDGPILSSQCTATGGGSTDDLTALTGTFECMAVNIENNDGTVSGYRYSGTAEWDTGSISWRLGG